MYGVKILTIFQYQFKKNSQGYIEFPDNWRSIFHKIQRCQIHNLNLRNQKQNLVFINSTNPATTNKKTVKEYNN
jgi:hypothetical protein